MELEEQKAKDELLGIGDLDDDETEYYDEEELRQSFLSWVSDKYVSPTYAKVKKQTKNVKSWGFWMWRHTQNWTWVVSSSAILLGIPLLYKDLHAEYFGPEVDN